MRHRLRKGSLITALMLMNIVAVGCNRDSGAASDSQAAPAPAPVQIVIDNFTFNPAEITLPAGTKVTWVNHDDVPHTATSSAKPRKFDSGTLDTDDKFSFVFTAPGTYDYFCAVHKHMTARITVK